MLHHQLETWQQPAFAREWAQRDGLAGLLAFPREFSAELVADARSSVELVIDIAAGPGAFLECYLQHFPNARGIWTDGSAAMQDQAQERLAAFGDRVEYRLLEMSDIAGAGLPSADVVLTSRATHHLDRVSLHSFYRTAAGLLGSQGWLVNLDHTDQPWKERYQRVLQQFIGPPPTGAGHSHTQPLPTLEDHLEGARDAGLDADLVWKAGRTVLIQGCAG